MTYHYIYITVLLCGSLEGHYYIGKHTTNAKPENCGYVGSGRILNEYFKKYGKIKGETYYTEVFEINQTKEENAESEKFYISTLWKDDPLCLNLKAGGDGGGVIGIKRSEETKRKISESLKGNPNLSHKGKEHPMYGKHITVSEETKEKIRNKLTGIKRSEEFCRQISERCKGKPVPIETRNKISNTLLGNIPWNALVGIKENFVVQLSKDGELIKIWDFSKEYPKFGKLCSIKYCCNDNPRYKSAYGYKWKYLSEYKKESPIN